jgi:hypothetical protein
MPGIHKIVECTYCKNSMLSNNLKKHIARMHSHLDNIIISKSEKKIKYCCYCNYQDYEDKMINHYKIYHKDIKNNIYVYKIYDIKYGSILYIGQSKNVKQRFYQHCTVKNNNDLEFYKLINSIGLENIKIQKLCSIDSTILNAKKIITDIEKLFIKLFQPPFNIVGQMDNKINEDSNNYFKNIISSRYNEIIIVEEKTPEMINEISFYESMHHGHI